MSDQNKLVFYYAPQSRASGTLLLLEELGAPYELHVLSLETGDQRKPDYLTINPLGKVPAIRYGDALVTEQPAIFIYLADLFPAAGLAPSLEDAQRGPYLRWMVLYGSCFEPAMLDRALKRDPGPQRQVGYGDFDTLFDTLTRQLEPGPYLLGDRFTAVDLLWGGALTFMLMFKLIPEHPAIVAYVKRHNARPAVARVKAKQEEIQAQLKAQRSSD